jgi:hypothetical protein
MPIFDQKHRQITGDSPVDITKLLIPQEPEPEPAPRRRRTVMEELGLTADQLQPLGQVDALTEEGQGIQDRVSGRRNTRVLDNILGEGTEQVQERRRERLGVAEIVNLDSIPDIETGGTKKTAKAIQTYIQNLPSYAERVTGIEESVLASSSLADRLIDAQQAKSSKKGEELSLAEKFNRTADILDEYLPQFSITDLGKTKDTLKSLVGGVLNSGIGGLRGLEALTGKQVIGEGAPILEWQKALEVENPTFANKLTAGFGSTMTFFIPGVGVAKGVNALSKGNKFMQFVATVSGSGVMSGLEALAEGGDIYETLLDQGMSKEEAAGLAQHGMGLNVIVLMATNVLGLGGTQITALRRALASAPMEATQEMLQTWISNYELGARTREDITNGSLESFIIGGIVGGVIGGATPGGLSKELSNKLDRAVAGEDVSFSDKEMVHIMTMRAQRDGVIGERGMKNLKPKNKRTSPEREGREAKYTGPEDLTPQEARLEIDSLITQEENIQKEAREAENLDPATENARNLAEEAVRIVGSPVTKGTIQKLTKKAGFAGIQELTPSEFSSLITQAREQAPSTAAKDIFNDILAASQEVTGEVDPNVFQDTIASLIEEKQAPTRKTRTTEELIQKFTGLQMLETEVGPGGTTGQDLINALSVEDIPLSALSPKGMRDAKATKKLTDKGVGAREAVRRVSERSTLDNLLEEGISEQERSASERLEDVLPKGMLEKIKKNKPLNRTQLLEQRRLIKESIPPGEMQDKMVADVNKLLKKGETATNAAKRRAREQSKRAEQAEAELKTEKKKTLKLKKISLIKKVQNELRTAKAKKQAGKPVGKYTASIQKAIDILDRASRMSEADVNAEIAENIQKINKQGGKFDSKLALENRLLSITVGLKNRSVTELESILSDIKGIKQRGVEMRFVQDIPKTRKFTQNHIDGLNALTNGKGIPKSAKTTGLQRSDPATTAEAFNEWLTKTRRTHSAWVDLMVSLSQKDANATKDSGVLFDIMDMHEVKNTEKKAMQQFGKDMQLMYYTAYNLKTDAEVQAHIMNDTKEINLGEFTNSEGITSELKFTKEELRKRYIEMQDPSLLETFSDGMMYTLEIRDAIESKMTSQDKAFADAQLVWYQKFYNKINPVYRMMYGVDLPFNKFYSPIRREGFDSNSENLFGDFLDEIQYRRSVAPGAAKSRVKSILPISKQSDMMVLARHFSQMNHFIAHAEKIQELRRFFDDPAIKAAIRINHGGENTLMVIDHHINNMTTQGRGVGQRIEKLDNLRAGFYRATVGLRAIITGKQLTSQPAFASEMPMAKFVQYSAEFWAHPMENTRMLYKDSVSLQTRGKTMERDMVAAQKTDKYKDFKKFQRPLDMVMLNVQLGDQGAIVSGGWPYYTYLTRDVGMSHLEAIDKLERQFETAQQSSDADNLNYWQTSGSLYQAFTMFQSTPIQFANKELNAVQNRLSGKIDDKELAKIIFIYHFLLPTIFQLVANLGKWNTKEQAASVVLGPFSSVFIAGQLMDMIVRQAAGVHVFDAGSPLVTVADGAVKALSNLQEKDVDAKDWEDAIIGLASTTGKLTGYPVEQAANFGYGMYDGITGDWEKAFLRSVLGTTRFQAENRLSDNESTSKGKNSGKSRGKIKTGGRPKIQKRND